MDDKQFQDFKNQELYSNEGTEEYYPEYEISGDKCSDCGNFMLKSPIDDRQGSYNWTLYCHFCGNTESE